MKILVKKISNPLLLKIEFIVGALIMAVAVLGLPVGVFAGDITLIKDPYVWTVILTGMLFFGLVGFFGFIRPYILCCKFPAVQVESDGEYLYIHAKKEAKILLSEISEATVHVDLPYLYQKEFLREILIHIFSEEYGNIHLEIPGHGEYKLRFVSHVQNTADKLVSFIGEAINQD